MYVCMYVYIYIYIYKAPRLRGRSRPREPRRLRRPDVGDDTLQQVHENNKLTDNNNKYNIAHISHLYIYIYIYIYIHKYKHKHNNSSSGSRPSTTPSTVCRRLGSGTTRRLHPNLISLILTLSLSLYIYIYIYIYCLPARSNSRRSRSAHTVLITPAEGGGLAP